MGVLAENLAKLSKGSRIYRLRVIVRLLLETEQYERLYRLLTDPDFREVKSKELGLTEVAADYRLVLESGCFDENLSRQSDLRQIYEELLERNSRASYVIPVL